MVLDKSKANFCFWERSEPVFCSWELSEKAKEPSGPVAWSEISGFSACVTGKPHRWFDRTAGGPWFLMVRFLCNYLMAC